MADRNAALRQQQTLPPYEFPLGDALRRAATVAPPASAVAQAVGDASRAALPAFKAQHDAAASAIQQYVDAGNYAAAAGRATSGAVGQVAGAANDVVGRPVLALAQAAGDELGGYGRGIANFVRGLVGAQPSVEGKPAAAAQAVRTATSSAASAPGGGAAPGKVANPPAAVRVTNPVDAAMAQGRGQAVTLAPAAPSDPQSALSQFLTQAFTRGVSVEGASRLGPLVQSAVKPVQSAKDARFEIAGQVVDELAHAQLAAVQQLDPGPARDAATLAWLNSYAANNSKLLGADPTKTAIADQIEESRRAR